MIRAITTPEQPLVAKLRDSKSVLCAVQKGDRVQLVSLLVVVAIKPGKSASVPPVFLRRVQQSHNIPGQ